MPKTKQQTTPRQGPPRGAKRSHSEATENPEVSVSASKASSASKRGSAVGATSSSAKKQKVQAIQDAVPASVENKENTPSDSQPRRSTRARTARVVKEVTPGPGLVKPTKDHSSTGKAASQSTQKQRRQKSAGREASSSPQKQDKVEAMASTDQSASGTVSEAAKASPLPTASSPKADERPLQELPSDLVPTETAPNIDEVPSEPFSSPQKQPSALRQVPKPFQGPHQPISLPSPCMHPSQHGLPSIPYQQPESPHKPDSPAGPALAPPGPGPAPAPSSTAADPTPQDDNASEHSSKEGSRQSSGHSNDHPIALVARKHLNWESAGPTSGISKPPLNKAAATQLEEAGTLLPSAAAAEGDAEWWDPNDANKVRQTKA